MIEYYSRFKIVGESFEGFGTLVSAPTWPSGLFLFVTQDVGQNDS